MMESAQNRHRDDSMIGRQLVALQRDHAIRRRIWKPRSQTATPRNGAKMMLRHRNHEVQILTADRPDDRSQKLFLVEREPVFENFQTYRLEGCDRPLPRNCVAIVDRESVIVSSERYAFQACSFKRQRFRTYCITTAV